MTAQLLTAAVLVCLPAAALAQESRAGSLAAQQAEKATHLTSPEPHWAENLVAKVHKSLLEQPAGFYPYFDSVYSGGGFTLGVGYRYFTGDRTYLNVASLLSTKGYKLLQGGLTSPGHFGGRLDVRVGVSWRDATRVAYRGLGIDSPADLDTAYRLQPAVAGGDLVARPHRWVRLTAAASYEDYTLKDPSGQLTPVDDVFTPETAPGLGGDIAYLHTSTGAAFDWRPAVDYARRGGVVRVAAHHYADRGDTYSFNRVETEVVQHMPILRETWVISLRGRLETTPGDDDVVPYFMLPSLGSGSTLRGYSSWRFRDRHSALLSGEWRWIVNRMALDMALFYDTGMVAPRLDDIAMNRFVSDFGVGIRFHTPDRTPLRVDVAKGSEGVNIVFSAGAAF